MKNIVKFLTLPILLSFCFMSFAVAKDTSIAGQWKTIDDKTNQPKSIVKIYQKGGKYYGKITKLFRQKGEDKNPLCNKCKEGDPRKGKPIKGMVILKDLVKKDDKYADGKILDPKNGKVYTCKLWIDEGKLKVRGYVGFFFRTQTWHRVK
jgi:uncharacterized protein (DUF2147 family)